MMSRFGKFPYACDMHLIMMLLITFKLSQSKDHFVDYENKNLNDFNLLLEFLDTYFPSIVLLLLLLMFSSKE